MEYEYFKKILDETIFKKTKAVLIKKIADYPERYVGRFRSTKPKAKILQNLLQSHEIRFGDGFEKILRAYIIELGYEPLQGSFVNDAQERLHPDQYFVHGNKVYLIEQKIRDDHDSSKKRGQIENFRKKIGELSNKHDDKKPIGIFYFIDNGFQKNKNYYKDEMKRIEASFGVETHLFYGIELFNHLGHKNIWYEMLEHLKKWKGEVPDFPETNFDIDAVNSFDEIKDLSPNLYRKILKNNDIYKEIILTIFPEKKTLILLLSYFREKSSEKSIYKTVGDLLADRLKN